MKEIIQSYQAEDAKYYCDKHPNRECFSELVLSSWYGSSYDLTCVKVHLCDECVQEMYEFLKKEYNATPKEVEI